VEVEIGLRHLGVWPNHLDELVLGRAALTAIQENREHRLGRARARLRAAPM
jgi:hypothetical protein